MTQPASPKFSVLGLLPGGTRKVSLAKSFIAARNLHAKESKSEIFATLQEIVANLVGSEDFAIYELRRGMDQLDPVVVCTAVHRQPRSVQLGCGTIGRVAQSCEIYVRRKNEPPDSEPGDGAIEACIPLVGLKGVLGILVLYSFLPQKEELEETDIQFLRLVAVNAAAALERLASEQESSGEHT